MCTYIYTLHKDCMHKQYQNTFKCVSARGSVFDRSSRSLNLDHTLHLPDAHPQQMPDPMCNEGAKHATRPVSGRCRACAREERAMRQKKMDDARGPEGMDTAAGVRSSILGLEQLVAATKPLDLEE
ncbi:hypothetical protein EsH8_II_001126 [Colletotrichum jinshuiense]